MRTVASRIGRPVRDSSTRPETAPPLDSRTSTASLASPSPTVTAAALPAWKPGANASTIQRPAGTSSSTNEPSSAWNGWRS